MPRKRSADDAWMPPRVYAGKSAYEYRPKIGPYIRLAPLSATRSELWAAYERLEGEAQNTVGRLFDLYLGSPQFKLLAARTQKDYEIYSKKLKAVFGHMDPNKVTAPDVRRYMDLRSARVQANREKAFFATAMAWGLERGYCKNNPIRDVKKHKETPRDRYITDDEYNAIYAAAAPHVKAAMEISYLCAARKGDVLALTESQLKLEGIFIRQGKTGKKQIKQWTQRLRDAVELAKSQPSTIKTMVIIHDANGQRFVERRFDEHWAKARESAGLADADIHFHDIKAKAISDYEGDKQKFSGHKSAQMVSGVYDRKTHIVETINRPAPKK